MPSQDSIKKVENSVRQVYDFCPPTKTYFVAETYKNQWGSVMTTLGLPPSVFSGLRLLDVGCGSCEKATFYHDWGAKVTGLDVSPTVLSVANQVIGSREILLIQGSIFDFKGNEEFDVIIADGVLHCTIDTFAALKATVASLKPGGEIIFSLVNVWGDFWWFPFARFLTRALSGSDFHRRALWGRRLFRWTRKKQEGTERTSQTFRSEDSWAYDWFGNPRWNLHSPSEVRNWLPTLGLEHVKSVPPIVSKENPRNWAARIFRRIFGAGTFMLDFYWLINKEWNTMFIHAVKKHDTLR